LQLMVGLQVHDERCALGPHIVFVRGLPL